MHVQANSVDFHLQVQTAPNNNTIINAFNNSHFSVVIADISIRNNVTTSIVHIHLYNRPVTKIVHHAVNITTIEAELFTIRCRINQAISIPITNYIVIITDSLYTVIKIFFLSQQFIIWGVMAVHAYRRNYVWSINTLTFLCSYPTQRITKELNP